MRVNTRAASMPPLSRTNAAAVAHVRGVGGSPARRSATYASTVVDRSPGPPGTSPRCRRRAAGSGSTRRAAVGQVADRDAEELAQQQVLGVHRDVGLELALPPAVGVLHRRAAHRRRGRWRRRTASRRSTRRRSSVSPDDEAGDRAPARRRPPGSTSAPLEGLASAAASDELAMSSVTARPPQPLDRARPPARRHRRDSRLASSSERSSGPRPSARSSAATTGSVFLP